MGDDEINLFVGGVVQQWEEYAVGVEPVVEHYEAIFFLGHETAMVYIVQLHGVEGSGFGDKVYHYPPLVEVDVF